MNGWTWKGNDAPAGENAVLNPAGENAVLNVEHLKHLIEMRKADCGKWQSLYQAMEKTRSNMERLGERLQDALKEIPARDLPEFFGNPEWHGAFPRVTLTLKTDEEIISEINENLKELSYNRDDSPQIQTLELEDIRRAYDDVRLDPMKRVAQNRAAYVENWDQWSKLRDDTNLKLLSAPGSGGHQRYEMSDPSRIRNYIGKHVGDQRKIYYHIAVLEAQIETHMPGIDAPFKLIDTVGVDDKSTETVNRVKYAASEERDAIVYTYRYVSYARRDDGALEKFEAEERGKLRRLYDIFEEQRDKDAKNRIAFLLNVPKEASRGDWVRDYFSTDDTRGIDAQDITSHVEPLKQYIRFIKNWKDGNIL